MRVLLSFQKEHGLDNELMQLALLSSQEDKLEAAKSVTPHTNAYM